MYSFKYKKGDIKMVKVKMKDIDKIGDITARLEILAYLNGLILFEIDEDILHKQDWVVRKDAADFLQENLRRALSELRDILLDDDFIISTK